MKRLRRDTTGETTGLGVFAALVFGAVALVVLSVILFFGMQYVGMTANSLGSLSGPENVTANPDPVTGEAVEFADTSGPSSVLEVYSVEDSTGYAVRLNGQDDSFVESDAAVEIASDDSWAVGTWARVNNSASGKTMTALSVDGRVLIQYNGTDSEWVAWYYDDGTQSSYRMTTAASDQPNNFAMLTVTRNATHVRFYRNATQVDVRDLSVSAVEDYDTGATNWNGSLDETRTFDDTANDSEVSDLHTSPVAPRPARDRTARITYDEGTGSTTLVYFTGESASLSNHSWTDTGLPGHELTDGVDYTLNQDSGTITALDGGRIDGAPVVWIELRYDGLNDVGEVGRSIGPAFGLFGTSVLVIPAAAVLAVLIGGLVAATTYATRLELPGVGRNGRNGR